MKQIADTSSTFDLNDIPRVAASDLQSAVQRLVAAGHADLLLGQGCDTARESFEEKFWMEFAGETSLGASILIRLWALADVLTARRLQAMLHDRGYLFLRQAAEVAAGQRFSAHRGLNPQHMIWSIKALDQDTGPAVPMQMPVPMKQRPAPALAMAA